MKTSDSKSDATTLRQKAEALQNKKSSKANSQLSEAEMVKLVHELEVHQIELEMQNEELMLAKSAIQEIGERYLELNDYAPTGYVTLSASGKIQQINFACARMLGKERSLFMKKLFRLCIMDATRPVFDLFFQKVFESTIKETCDVTLSTNGSTPTYVHLSGIASESGEYCLITVVDITERKLVEEALREGEAWHRTILQTAMDGVWSLDVEGRILEVNAAYCRMSGYTERELMAMNISDLSFETASDTIAHIQKIMVQGEDRFESLHRRKDGSMFDVEVSVQYHPSNGGRCVAFLRDITERKRSDTALYSLRMLLETILESTDNGVLVVDLGGTVLKVNGRFAEMWRIPDEILASGNEEKLLTCILNQLTDPDAFLEKVKTLYRNPRDESLDLVYFKDGRIFERTSKPLGVAGAPAGRIWSFHDITESKKTEEKLQLMTNRLSLATQAGGVGIWDYDVVNNRLIWDEQMYRLYGITANQFSGAYEAWRAGLHPEDEMQGDEEIQMALHGEKDFNTEFRVVWPDGSIHTIRAFAQVRRSASGQALRMIGTNWDITERKQAEAALRESEKKHRLIFENACDAIFINGGDGKTLAVNPLACERLGYSSSELMSMSIGTVDSPEQNRFVPDRIAKLMEQGRVTFETVHQRKDGSVIPTEVNARRIVWDGQPAIISICRDITERKRIALAFQESEGKYRTMIEFSNDMIWTLDNNGNFTFLNAIALNTTGLSLNEWIGRSFVPLILEEDIPMIMDVFTKNMQGVPGNYELRLKKSDESLLTISVNTSPIYKDGIIDGIVSFGRDITERKHSERLLALERERLAITLRSIGDGVITTDIDGKVVMLNKAAEEMTGWKSEDAAGQPIMDIFVIVNEHTHEQSENPVEKALSTGSIVELANHVCLISKNGSEIAIADSVAPIRDNESRIIGAVLVFRDTTEKQKLIESMQRAQKLESLGILAGGIAHDFNNMLAGIFGYLDLAKESVLANKTDQIPKYLDKALGVFDRAKGLTQQLLTFSKGGAPIRTTMQIAPLIQHSAIFAVSGSNVKCRFDIADDLWLCDCDENQIGQAIDNIVINAKQAMPMGGKIIITAVNIKEVLGHHGAFVRISIKDEGIGIPHEILPKIFDPFFSTKTTGHGLGLATVFSIIKRHDGWIDVDSAQGKGSTFHLFIPASEKTTCSATVHETVKHQGTGTILVMDDEECILEIVGTMLESVGYTVAMAKDGREALRLFVDAERLGQPFLASILDLTIPGGIGGKEVAVAMHKINPNSKIIVSSGYSGDLIISNPTEYGFTDKITKPYRKDELTELMIRVEQLKN